jgi:hypothetical protein
MTFRQLIMACRDSKECKLRTLDEIGLERFIKAADDETVPRHRFRRWFVARSVIAHRYEKETGNKLVDWGDGKVIKWVKENWGTIVKLLIALLPLFL